MFKLLDIYLLKKYLATYVYVVFLFVLIFCAIDYTEKNDEFIQANLSFGQVFSEYYINFIPWLGNYLSPILVFVSTILITARLASHTEIIAMLSAGISFLRILLSFMMGSVMLAVLIFVLQGWVMPLASKKRIEFEVKYLEEIEHKEYRNYHMSLGQDVLLTVGSYQEQNKMGRLIVLERVVGRDVLQRIEAGRMFWNDTLNKWTLQSCDVRLFDGEEERFFTIDKIDTALSVKPSDFTVEYKKQETLTLPELDAYIADRELKGKPVEQLLISKYERYSYPFAIIILTAMAVIVAARKSRGGVGLQIALGLVLALSFMAFVHVGKTLAEKGEIAPIMMAWLPNVVFIFVAFILYKTVPR